MPHTGLADWMRKPEDERKAEEAKMKGAWDAWAEAHKDSIVETAGAGKTTRVTGSGPADTANDIMMYSLVQGESKEAVTQMFVGHPHLEISGAWIDVMPANMMK